MISEISLFLLQEERFIMLSLILFFGTTLFYVFFYDISISAEEGITVGKFYATFLIQEYFRRFKKKRQDERRRRNADSTVSLKVCIEYYGFKE